MFWYYVYKVYIYDFGVGGGVLNIILRIWVIYVNVVI